ncbi:hypothetical protein DS745_09425 [Anaerobacillus alkaliphilus]|uniref:Uncharacterized protein n=1 Tax=Anaerobacillus alkaliphilus TaxID=1548597 RepID=A0A4Q0VTT5_9BACI|nr:hypothetical protein [Anaerobacillus alkaliphilus]RXJ01689.1 hypothetical protein DS745_09425 [Anaerobacillus alkaliphilus]
MKYLYGGVLILILGFVVAAAEHHLNVTSEKSTETIEFQAEKNIPLNAAETHGVPTEFLANTNKEYVSPLTSEQIKEPYLEQFEVLQADALEEISSLIKIVYEDYVTKKENDEPISYLYFYRNYYPKLKQLEEQINLSFTDMYKQLEQELIKQGYSAEKALPIKEQFEQTKKDHLKELMALVTNGF